MVKELSVSNATLKNWERLKVDESEIKNKLSKRANKLYSEKNIFPKEYFSDKNNIKIINNLLNQINNNSSESIEEIIYNLALNQLKSKQFISLTNNEIKVNEKYTNLKNILSEFKNIKLNDYLINYNLPENENDVLGIIYQSLQKEGSKNKKGSYYTPTRIIEKIKDKIHNNTIYLDCSCGTGSFILTLSDKINNPQNIYGCDIDKIACFISKINLIMKYPQIDFLPNIFNTDFLTSNIFDNKQFDLIATNLPWNSKGETTKYKNNLYSVLKSKEIFSRFIVKSETLLSKNGKCIFLLPESILNVKIHSDIRKFILDKFFITKIELLGKPFSSVLTDVIFIELDKRKQNNFIEIIDKDSSKTINQNFYLKNNNYNFAIIDNKDAELLNKIYSIPHTTLKDSTFGLGIVTGNNEKYIKSKSENTEKIFTGKNITPYILEDSNNYIHYKRENFQQVADETIYRAKEKLVYKFISKNLVFAYDDKQRLFLNSANILIPNVETHSAKTVMAFLNSKLFKYIYTKKFNELKILKGNLIQLPFPLLDKETKSLIENLAENYINSKNKNYLEKIDNIIFEIFSIDFNIQFHF